LRPESSETTDKERKNAARRVPKEPSYSIFEGKGYRWIECEGITKGERRERQS